MFSNKSSLKANFPDLNIPYILQLPHHILGEIFCKIQIKTLVQCRFVCKFWHRLLSDPQFTEQLFSRRTCLLLRTFGSEVHLATLENDSSSPNDVAWKLSNDTIVLPTRDAYIKTPCSHFYISNPIMGESLAPPTPPDDYIISFPCGFGFSPISGAYKLVRFRFGGRLDPNPEVLVLTIGSGAWRSIENFRLQGENEYLGDEGVLELRA
ncbi:hypothetical protein PRUPE_1G169900 [Prunus persica]|uniref:F-box domain-containing protein n=1 Tax=Prunus persica TaxID=3760 RepID=A0A251QYM0_PRUPE|nr:hypothetical protein PRUPE_1G169900 [Prunus persica]